VVKVDEGYRKDVWERYEAVLDAFEEMEKRVSEGGKTNK
jgi:hypothetical protein